MELEIVFPLKGTYGQGTGLTHAAKVGADKTLCGKHIAPEWLYDANWIVDRATLKVHGPECRRCIASAFARLEAHNAPAPSRDQAGTGE